MQSLPLTVVSYELMKMLEQLKIFVAKSNLKVVTLRLTKLLNKKDNGSGRRNSD
jgi:hypothetical protein